MAEFVWPQWVPCARGPDAGCGAKPWLRDRGCAGRAAASSPPDWQACPGSTPNVGVSSAGPIGPVVM